MDYKNGKIYAIRSYQTDMIYIGSTCSPLSKRFHDHKIKYKEWVQGKRKYVCRSKEIFKYGDAYIELIQETPCKNILELKKFEGNYIRSMNCVNRCIPLRTNTERYYDNQKERQEYGRQYYNKNKKEIIKKRCEEYICICGKPATRIHKNRHEKTKKHRTYIFNLHNELNHL